MNPEAKQYMYIDSLRNEWRTVPPSLQVAITDVCFNACPMCGHWKRKNKTEMPLDEWKNVLYRMQTEGLETVCYSGGDPFKYSRLNELMAYHVFINMPFSIITAGYVPAHIDLKLLAQAKWVRISLDTLDPKLYKKIRGGSIEPKLITDSISFMKNAGVNVQFNLTAHRLNLETLRDVFSYAVTVPVSKITIKPVIHDTDLSLNAEQEQFLESMLQEFRDMYDDPIEGIEHDLVSWQQESYDPEHCYACLYQLFINPDGAIYPCCIMAGDTESEGHCPSLGNILTRTWGFNRVNIKQFFLSSPPEYCKENCLARHRIINEECHKLWTRKSAF